MTGDLIGAEGNGDLPSPWKEIGPLPALNLRRIFQGPAELTAARADLCAATEAFVEKYTGQVERFSTDQYRRFLTDFESIRIQQYCLGSFAGAYKALYGFADGLASSIMLETQKATTDLIRVIEPGHNKLIRERGTSLRDDPALSEFRPFIARRIELLSKEPSADGVPLYAVIGTARNEIAKLHHIITGDLWDRARRPDPDRAKIAELTDEHATTFASMLSTLHGNRSHLMKWLGDEVPYEEACRDYWLPPKALAELMEAVKELRPVVNHTFWRWRANRDGVEKIQQPAGRSELLEEDKRIYSWATTREAVKSVFAGISTEFAPILEEILDTPLVDAMPAQGRSTQTFATLRSPTFPGFVFMNYTGHIKDVIDTAHEVKHLLHSVFALEQRYLMQKPSLVTAETTTLFTEKLMQRHLLENCEDPDKRDALRAGFLQQRLFLVFDRMRCFEFDLACFEAVTRGQGSKTTFNELWATSLKENYGEAVDIDPSRHNDWMFEQQLFLSDFYAPTYAVATLLSDHLLAEYDKRPDRFRADYVDLLKAGGAKSVGELFAPFGVVEMDKAFWMRSFDELKAEVNWLTSNEILSGRPENARFRTALNRHDL